MLGILESAVPGGQRGFNVVILSTSQETAQNLAIVVVIT